MKCRLPEVQEDSKSCQEVKSESYGHGDSHDTIDNNEKHDHKDNTESVTTKPLFPGLFSKSRQF